METMFDEEMHSALQQLMDETIEALQLAKVSPDLDDLGATFAVALLKLGLATTFVEQKYSGFAQDVEEKRQRKGNKPEGEGEPGEGGEPGEAVQDSETHVEGSTPPAAS